MRTAGLRKRVVRALPTRLVHLANLFANVAAAGAEFLRATLQPLHILHVRAFQRLQIWSGMAQGDACAGAGAAGAG